jgi:hypothetical protein
VTEKHTCPRCGFLHAAGGHAFDTAISGALVGALAMLAVWALVHQLPQPVRERPRMERSHDAR